ncbi:mCG147520 [Mus musculus]|nr:mCG147520 [Mus musculus]
MLAARTGAAGSQISEDNSKFRKQSGLSSGGKDRSPKKAPENAKDSSLSPTGQSQLRARQLALLREVEMNWYLKLCELSSEHTTAHTTGMPHSLSQIDFDASLSSCPSQAFKPRHFYHLHVLNLVGLLRHHHQTVVTHSKTQSVRQRWKPDSAHRKRQCRLCLRARLMGRISVWTLTEEQKFRGKGKE